MHRLLWNQPPPVHPHPIHRHPCRRSQSDLSLRISPEPHPLLRNGDIMPGGHVEMAGFLSLGVDAGGGGLGKVQPAVVEVVFYVGGRSGQTKEEASCTTWDGAIETVKKAVGEK